MYTYYLTIVLAPLVAAIVVGLFGWKIGRASAHWITIVGVGISCALSLLVLKNMFWGGAGTENISVYTWAVTDGLRMEVGFLVDRLTALMMCVVTFVSLMVHIYTIGYMEDDPGYQRFFSYISLFTFSMLMLVMSNNFLQLFFGWEAVGLVSYLLIGFWFKRESAIFANLKAFLVNRVGDFGFILGISGVVMFAGSLDYATVFAGAEGIAAQNIEVFGGTPWNAMTVVCILLFIGAMGKSAQAPLHVWLPDSMEGPTPISALIHAATMVTAGIFMVARMSPLFELYRDWGDHRLLHGPSRYRAKRHQTCRRVLDAVATGLHDGRAGRFGVQRSDFPSDDACIFQSAAVPRCRLGDHRAASRAGHSQDGRHQEIHADYLLDRFGWIAGADRFPGDQWLLLQRPADRSRERIALARAGRGLLDRVPERVARCVRNGIVFLPHVLPRLSRRRTHGCRNEVASA
jgi:hypothetical protein